MIKNYFLDGKLSLDEKKAEAALGFLAKELRIKKNKNLDPAKMAACGIINIVQAHMEKALRVISVQKGIDPRDYILVSFGGAGGLHAADLARNLGIRKVLIPPYASTLSAYGMLSSDIIKDYIQTVMVPVENVNQEKLNSLKNKLNNDFSKLLKRSETELQKEKVKNENIFLEKSVDMRYKGQSFELNIPFSEKSITDFHQWHEKEYGYCNCEDPIEIVNIRLRAVAQVLNKPVIPSYPIEEKIPKSAFLGTREIVCEEKIRNASVYEVHQLVPGNKIRGPAILIQKDSTIFIGKDDFGEMDSFRNVILNVR